MAKSNVVLQAFSVDHAARITGLSKARLTRWDKLGFFSPEFISDEDRGNAYSRVYSYLDLVGLRTLAVLADEHHVPISELKKAADGLAKLSDRPWAQIPLSVLKRQVVFDLNGTPRNASDGQHVIKSIPLPSIAEAVAKRANELRKRKTSLQGKIEHHKFVVHNARVIAGTRIPVSTIRQFLDAGYTDAAIIEEFPTLTRKDILAVRRDSVAA
jgi:uncharacterized protein (DUF433 family)